MRCGPYELLGELGRGGMGAVFRARHVDTGADVALKVMTHVGDADDVRRFVREGEATARLRHPGIVPVHAAGVQDGRPWLAMDLLAGETLAQRLARGPLDAPAARRLFARIASALEHAHRHGVVHRDLKPENVVLDPLGEPRLIDFGLAQVGDRSRLTRTGDVLGTPIYMAPEQVRGDAAAQGPRTDVYGLGATLYHALTGRPPFAGQPLAVLEQVLTRAPVDPAVVRPGVDRDLAALCRACLEKDPARRPASAAAVARALEGRAPARVAGRRAPAAVGLAVLVVIGAAGVAAAALLARDAAPDDVAPASASTTASTTTSTPSTTTPPPAAEAPPAPDPVAELVAQADAHAAAGRLDAAIAALTAALDAAPDRAELRVRRGVLRYQAGDPAGAWDDLATSVDAAPSVDGYVARARLRGLHDPHGAADDARSALALDPRSPDARVALGAYHDLLGDPVRAREEADLALEAAPTHVEALLLSAKLHVGAGDLQAGRADAEAGLARSPDDPRLLALRGAVRAALHEDEGAVDDLMRVGRLTGELTVGEYVMLAKALFRLRRWEQADQAYALALGAAPADDPALQAELLVEAGQVRARVLHEAALAAREGGDLASAHELLSAAIEHDPTYGAPVFDRGDVLLDAGDPRAALPDFEAAVQLTDDPQARLGRAEALLALGDGPRALDDVEQAIARAGATPTALLLRALARWLATDAAGALADCDALRRAAPQAPEPLVLGAELRLSLGDAAGAERDAGAALALVPNDATSLVLRARARAALGRRVEAGADLDEACRSLPSSPMPLLFRGLHRRGDPATSAAGDDDLARAARADAPVPRDRWCRAEARALLGDASGALADCDAALAVDGGLLEALLLRARLRREAGDLEGALADLGAGVARSPPESDVGRALRAELAAHGGLR